MSTIFWLGNIRMGSGHLTGPTAISEDRRSTFATYAVTRGKPVLHEIGEELDTMTIDFFFSEEFCSPEVEKARLEAAFLSKTPLPLTFGNGSYRPTRYVVDGLSIDIIKTSKTGRVVRMDGTLDLVERPVNSLSGLIDQIRRAAAPAITGRAVNNLGVRK